METNPHEGASATTASPPKKKRGAPKTAAIKVKPFNLEALEGAATTEYLCGTLDTCPMQNVQIAGVSFARFSGLTDFDKGGKPESPVPCGSINHLTDAQVEQVKTSVSMRILRAHGENPNGGTLYLVDSRNYLRSAADKPLAVYLYMVPRAGIKEGGREWTRPDFQWFPSMLEE